MRGLAVRHPDVQVAFILLGGQPGHLDVIIAFILLGRQPRERYKLEFFLLHAVPSPFEMDTQHTQKMPHSSFQIIGCVS